MRRLFRRAVFVVSAAASALLVPAAAQAVLTEVFFTDFNAGAPVQFSGVTTTEGVQGYAGLGPAGNQFGGNFLRNTTTGNPASFTTLTLTGLAPHTSVDINFLLAIIDSWDGTATSVAPDFFQVFVDSVSIFSQTFDNFALADQGYVPPPGVQLTSRGGGTGGFSNLGFNGGFGDAAYNMYLEPAFTLPHTASTLTVQWRAAGAGWQGGNDESWAIENVQIVIDTVQQVPEPATLLLVGTGLGVMVAIGRRRRRRT